MKLKFLYLFLATGFLFLETNAWAQGASTPSITTKFCAAVNKIPQLPAACTAACTTTSIPNPLQLGQCAVALSRAGNAPLQEVMAVACDASCTSHWTSTCSSSPVLSVCGYICCNIPQAAGKVTNCLSTYGVPGQNTCAFYNVL